MSRFDRDRDREEIRSGVKAKEDDSYDDERGLRLPVTGREAEWLQAHQLGAIARAICNLAETLDAKGDDIRAAVRGDTSAIERAAHE